MQVRLATIEDVDALVATNAQAFKNDPLVAWLFPGEQGRIPTLRRYYRANIKDLLASGEVWCTDDRHAIAKWQPPGAARLSLTRLVRLLPAVRVVPRLGPSLRTGFRAMQLVEGHRPERPHWYLSGLATDPAHQGQGYATSLLNAGLSVCDRGGLDAYLETGRPENVGFYQRFGFVESGEIVLPDGGPRLWTMTRAPS
jgi:ribosomal protein S18 acetylase RimI-like enzyme